MACIEIIENYPLADLTTFRVGGAARYFVSVRSEEEALEAIDFAKMQNLPIFILGGGSNVLISDKGFDGLVILNRINGFHRREEGGDTLVHAGSGEDWQEFVDRCIADDLQGTECLAGIPGTVGASPVQNIGAYGQSVSDTIAEVGTIDMDTGRSVSFGNKDCRFEYRKSIFNTVAAGRYLITSVTFRLKKNGKVAIRYRELENRLREISDVTIQQVRDCVIAIRDGKGLLVRPGHECFQCAGSFFKNPVVDAESFKEIEKKVRKAGGCSNWAWPVDSGEVKISAACLIQSAGFTCGYRKGNVGLSPRHTLIVVAYEGSTAQDVVDFAREVQEKVRKTFGVRLSPEVRFVGF
ncbi:UDP-N-acetylmuramate dehydrogenase [Desulforhabdus amnigena]|uniref:UDP-N-acetylenolpyruvoylglucosamine reductase n=1 Tax=Desulforhabdus amnigena TaxID=40218 RepID=A0A9W6FTC8_9BACT|nr:UDP-N-acetylmuramate dehydrogenase [Desulforhabdus amnigena]GLI32931.1 UDP-N-acetylenolpyruvoylglucosamine reductase [Desulforhabdus amnigena]